MLYDKDIREPLFDFLEERFGKIRIIEEKRMGRSRADILMVLEGAVMGLEIKSDADTYARLSRQGNTCRSGGGSSPWRLRRSGRIFMCYGRRRAIPTWI